MTLALLVVAMTSGQAVETPAEGRPLLRAVRLTAPVTLDGSLTEAVWQEPAAATSFVQRDPAEGEPATEATDVRIAYDDDAIYVGARMYDAHPDQIIARLGRRDAWLDADAFVFYLDPYHDGRSGFFFSVNAAGTLRDGTLFNDDWDDDSWDGVWEGKARIDAQGWTAEMRIPYSQLRFKKADAYRWGVNARRYVGRKKEDDYLVFTPKKASGFVSRFPELVGITAITPPRRASITPYVTTKAEYAPGASGNPFNDGSRYHGTLGADAKIGLGTSLTLDATVNPDFGQVEVDPAVVNLSDVETFFDEKRPFFIEGSNLLQFGFGGASNFMSFNWPNPSFFYSRRIGRAPHGTLPEADFADVPSGTSLVGAAKLTGKVGDHWNLATLHALTQRESAALSLGGQRSRAEVEPAAYYGVFRIQREFPENRRGIGFLATTVRRSFDDPRLRDQMNAEAYSLGVDGWTFLDGDKKWVATGWAGASHVRGDAADIAALQQSPQHYFQRPDAGHVHLDPTRTSLTGFAGRAALNKEKGNVLFNAGFGFIDPSFDTNDVGFIWRADLMNAHVWTGYRWTEPNRVTRSADVEVAAFRSYDFDGNKTWDGYMAFAFAQWRNYAKTSAWIAYNPETLSNTRTRGGPLTLNPRGVEWDAAARTDDRRSFWVRVAGHGWDYALASSHGRSGSVHIEWKPRPNLSLSLIPEMEWRQEGAQWVGVWDDPANTATFGKRYVFAHLAQKTFAAGVRLNWTFTPRLSLQLYAQPLVSSGDYSGFGELAQPRSFSFVRYPDGAPPVPVGNPDFNYKSLRGNAVGRWEFHPGSTLYLVWTQNRSDVENVGDLHLGRSIGRLFGAKADNIFLMKIAWWFSR